MMLMVLLNVVVIGNRTMPIVDELADSNTIGFCYCMSVCIYVCMYVCMVCMVCMFVYMYYSGRFSAPRFRRLDINASYWDRRGLCNGAAGKVPCGFGSS